MKHKTQFTKHFVTGGAGFIGSHLAEKLLAENNLVTVYDNLSSGSAENLKTCLNNNNFTFIQDDMLNTSTLTKAMVGYDVVWHLGANTDIQKGNSIQELDLKNCTVATFNVLESMRTNKICSLVFSSSCTVYGDSSSERLSENHGPLMPISLYGAGKVASEGLISAYSHLYGIKACIFRFANVLGPRMKHGVIFDFIKKLKQNPKVLEILGDGFQDKPYFLVEDCLDGMLTAFQKSTGDCEIFNLGCTTSTQVNRIAQIVVEEMGLKNVVLKYTSGKRGWPGDIPKVLYDIRKIKQLGWEPKHSSDQAVIMATRSLLRESD